MQGTVSPQIPASRKAAPKRYPRSFWWYLKWFFITLQLIVFCAIVVTVTAGYGIYQQLSKIMPDVNGITSRNRAEATRIYAADGTLLAEIKGEQRRFIPISDLKVSRQYGKKWISVPGRLIDATLSIEDKRFYTHPGMDPKRIAGAALANFRSRDSTSQGGSTITEQLAVNVYLTRTKTLSRRLQTALLALQLEKRFSKDEILELYLNEIYYGNRAYGCEAAAQTYLQKSAKELTISEAALLAGLPNSPGILDPFEHFDRAKKRQRLVLREMYENKKLNWTQYKQALADDSIQERVRKAEINLNNERKNKQRWRAPYYVSYVKSYLQKQYGWSDDFLNKSGLKIYTSLDMQMQAAAEEVMKKRLASLGRSKLEGALVCIDPWTGHVLAMYGGRDFYDKRNGGEWNRAVQGKRPSGSSFKPYVYAAAMEAGLNPDSVEIDKPLFINKHQIRNYTRRHDGAMTLREAMGKSNNVIAVKTLLKVGIGNVIQKAHMMGVESALDPYASLALGVSNVSLLEHVSAYGVFATEGVRAEETPIERVDDYNGKTLVEHEHPVHGARVLSNEAAKNMWQMLRYVVTSGTGKNAQINGVEVVGKTGTTSSNKDVWFMGATHQLACGVWLGYDKPKDLGGDSAGGAWSAPAWRAFMVRALDIWSKRVKVDKMVEDARATDQRRLIASQYKKIIQVRICNESGLLANALCKSTRVVEFSSAEGVPAHCDIPAHVPKAQTVRDLGDDEGISSSPQPGDLGFEPNAPTARDEAREIPTDSGGAFEDNSVAADAPPDEPAPREEKPNGKKSTRSDDEGLARDSEDTRKKPGRSTAPRAETSDDPVILNPGDEAPVDR